MKCIFVIPFLLFGISFAEYVQNIDPYQTEKISFLAISNEDTNSDLHIHQSKCGHYPEGAIYLPEDEKVHDNLEEWWFASLQIYSEIGTHYAAQWSFVKEDFEDIPSIQLSFAFYDPKKFKYTTRIKQQKLQEVNGEFSLNFGDARGFGKNGTYSFYGSIDDTTLEVQLEPIKAPFLYFDDGSLEPYYGGYIQYYCQPRSVVTGTLTIGEQAHRITGYGYYEHAFGRLRPLWRVGWDWIVIQLDGGSEIIIGISRLYSYLWVYDAECMKERKDFEIRPLNTWVSEITACQYAISWSLRFENKQYLIQAVHPEGEMVERAFIKYETPIIVSGTETGRGFIESMGTC
jgi:predicted secreted hydrolase